MRKDRNAPVDIMGASRQGDESLDINSYAYQTLVALMLSA